ncbi:DNA circularization protein [Candidatus Williamhamiltonella defendens]|uniref:DNA circularization protein n=1 Tax=Candidatus Hamiltonella defensa (Bemisia tabaci) TaxID=672795 RepID=A0A249DW85_9ENTR|nr:DNA circularization N-terminal domain-containing protein [Candidatus Hamiltonella defensa]ASX25784.1 DNA circularization protein [Candidatus Hamiltonella defensa (Bemisia tabaci)]
MTDWTNRLHPASFRGVPFQVEGEEGTFGRRVQTHEYPNRDKPYTEDLGRATRRFQISAYLVGEDYLAARDRLIGAIETPGPGTLVHPYYGELSVCMEGDVRVSHSGREGRLCRIRFSVVEAGTLSFPTADIATSQTLLSSSAALNDRISDAFTHVGLKGLPDFAQAGVLAKAKAMTDHVTQALDSIDSRIAAASRLLKGDMSVILKPGSSGKHLIEAIQRLWRSGRRTRHNANMLTQQIKTLSGITLGHDLAPRGVWKSDRPSVQAERRQSNRIAALLRTTAIHEAALRLTQLPPPRTALLPVNQREKRQIQVNLSHPALHAGLDASDSEVESTAVTWETLMAVREALNQAIEREQTLSPDDALFLALQRVKTEVNRDMATRLAQVDKTVLRTPETVLPALVLAAQWYDNASRERDITSRNRVPHPGFVPQQPLRVPLR